MAATIVTFNRPNALLRTLGAVLGQTRRPDEVHVVDNGGGDTAQLVHEVDPAVNYHQMPENLGYAAGLGIGMKASLRGEADFVWLLDDDSTPRENGLQRCLEVACSNLRFGIVGLNGGSVRRGVPIHESLPLPNTAVEGMAGAYRCDFVLVDGSVVARSAIEDVGYPRADFFMMMEDVEYSRRLSRAGWDVIRLSDDLIERSHLGSSGSTGRAPPWRGYYQTRNHLHMALHPFSPPELVGWALRQARFVGGTALSSDHRSRRIRLRLLGTWDGLRGVMGRTVEPDPE